ncbi:ladderlectin-like [Polymixia lowei]
MNTDITEVGPQARINFCLEGWQSFRGNCYLLVNAPASWSEAERHCGEFESSLVAVHSIWEHRFVQRLAITGGHAVAWMGGYFFQGEWRWEDGTVFDYSKIGSISNPNSYQCLQLNTAESVGWSNHGCNMPFPYVCKLSVNC